MYKIRNKQWLWSVVGYSFGINCILSVFYPFCLKNQTLSLLLQNFDRIQHLFCYMYVYCLFLVFKYEITEPKDEPFGNHVFFNVFFKKNSIKQHWAGRKNELSFGKNKSANMIKCQALYVPLKVNGTLVLLWCKSSNNCMTTNYLLLVFPLEARFRGRLRDMPCFASLAVPPT